MRFHISWIPPYPNSHIQRNRCTEKNTGYMSWAFQTDIQWRPAWAIINHNCCKQVLKAAKDVRVGIRTWQVNIFQRLQPDFSTQPSFPLSSQLSFLRNWKWSGNSWKKENEKLTELFLLITAEGHQWDRLGEWYYQKSEKGQAGPQHANMFWERSLALSAL